MDSMADAADIPRTKLSPYTSTQLCYGPFGARVDLVSIQRLMGHSNISTTRVYLELVTKVSVKSTTVLNGTTKKE